MVPEDDMRYMLVCGLMVMALLGAGLADAATVDDDTDDVLHWKWSENMEGYAWTHAVTDRPNIDITELSYMVDGDMLMLTMTVQGEIEEADDVWYWAEYNTSDATYTMTYVNGSGTHMARGSNDVRFGNVSATGDTITASVELLGSDGRVSFKGWAASGYSRQTSGEYWQDWAPQEYAPDINRGNGGDGGVPGFTLLLVLGGLAAVLVSVSRRRQ